MGERHAIATMLLGGGIVVPLALFMLLAGTLGPSAIPAGLVVAAVGLAALIFAKWTVLRVGAFWHWGTNGLTSHQRKLYWGGYGLIAFGLMLAILGRVLA